MPAAKKGSDRPRERMIQVSCRAHTDDVATGWMAAADKAGMTLSHWMREELGRAAKVDLEGDVPYPPRPTPKKRRRRRKPADMGLDRLMAERRKVEKQMASLLAKLGRIDEAETERVKDLRRKGRAGRTIPLTLRSRRMDHSR